MKGSGREASSAFQTQVALDHAGQSVWTGHKKPGKGRGAICEPLKY